LVSTIGSVTAARLTAARAMAVRATVARVTVHTDPASLGESPTLSSDDVEPWVVAGALFLSIQEAGRVHDKSRQPELRQRRLQARHAG